MAVAEQGVGERAQREDVDRDRVVAVAGHDFRRGVDGRARVVDHPRLLAQVHGHAGVGGAVLAGDAALPVAQHRAPPALGVVVQLDGPRTQRAVVDVATVRIRHGFGNRTDQLQPLAETRGGGGGIEQVVQALGFGVEVVDQGRADVAFGELQGAEDGVVADIAQQRVFAGGDVLALALFGLGRALGVGEDADALMVAGHALVGGLPVLVAVVLGDQAGEPVVAHGGGAGTPAQPEFLHRAAQCALAVAADAGAAFGLGGPALDDVDDAVRATVAGVWAQVDVLGGDLVQRQFAVRFGQEHDGLDIWHLALVEGPLPAQQRLELARLAVGQQQRVLLIAFAAAGRAHQPAVLVAADVAGPVLDLDQVDAVAGDHQRVDFIDAAVFGDELEVGPGAKRRGFGQVLTQQVQGLLLMRIVGWVDGVPAAGLGGHVLASWLLRRIWLRCDPVGHVLHQILNPAIKVRAQAIQRIRAHVGAPVEHARQGDTADARGLGDFAQGDAPALLELLGGDALLELEPEH